MGMVQHSVFCNQFNSLTHTQLDRYFFFKFEYTSRVNHSIVCIRPVSDKNGVFVSLSYEFSGYPMAWPILSKFHCPWGTTPNTYAELRQVRTSLDWWTGDDSDVKNWGFGIQKNGHSSTIRINHFWNDPHRKPAILGWGSWTKFEESLF